MIYPGYMLNPGDMFQVEPDSVMTATGAMKTRPGDTRKRAIRTVKQVNEARKAKKAAKAELAEPKLEELDKTPEPTTEEVKKDLKSLMADVEHQIAETVKAKSKQELRALRRQVRKTMALGKGAKVTHVTVLESQLSALKSQVTKSTTPSPNTQDPTAGLQLSRDEEAKFLKAFERLKEQADYDRQWNRFDPTKPYITPWRPKNYMPAFAFIPRYLEVNQNICAAVYLRHPVARPGLAEVPTPFAYETGQLAFNWYLRRR
jgi:ribosomal protein S4